LVSGYPDWQEFSKWCKRHVENPRVTHREADLKYFRATQRSNQKVMDYNQYLTGIFGTMKTEPSEEEKIRRLNTGVREELRREEARRPPMPEDASYEDMLTRYQEIESDQLSSKTSSSSKKAPEGPSKRRREASPKEDEKEPKRQKYPECPHCGLKNHAESKCFKKHGYPKKESSNKIESKK
jgi:hypothetical protein